MIVPMFGLLTGLISAALAIMAVFMILLVLVQRGRGGGLAGALGGMGGSSAFGAKAGDVFTRITAGAAFVWIMLSIFAAWYNGGATSSKFDVSGSATAAGDSTEDGAPALTSAGGDAAADEDQATDGASDASGDGSSAESSSGEAAPDETEPAKAAN